MTTTNTFIAPGRRYLQLRGRANDPEGRITILPVARDERPVGRLTFRPPQPAVMIARCAVESPG